MILHPWESGCDDSPRWDAWATEPWTYDHWKQRKGDLVEALRFDARSPVGQRAVRGRVAGLRRARGVQRPRAGRGRPATRPARRADATSGGWPALAARARDVGRRGAGRHRPARPPRSARSTPCCPCSSPTTRRPIDAAFAVALDDAAFGGPSVRPPSIGTSRRSTRRAYWRGPAWPQLTYLLWVAAHRRGRTAVADDLAARLVTGARRSGLAEYWHPDTGEGLGAVPQSWAALAAVVGPT